MIPLRDNVPTRSFPVVTVALIAINAAVWLLYQLPNLDRSLQDLAFHPCEVNSSCPAGFHGDKGWLLTDLDSDHSASVVIKCDANQSSCCPLSKRTCNAPIPNTSRPMPQ